MIASIWIQWYTSTQHSNWQTFLQHVPENISPQRLERSKGQFIAQDCRENSLETTPSVKNSAERVNKTTPRALSFRQLDAPGTSSFRRLAATEDLSSGKKVNLRPNTDGEQYIKKFGDPAKSFKPQSDEEHEFYNRVLDGMCARFGKYPANLQDFKLNVAIWSKFTSDCLWASSWLAEDHNDFKRMATNLKFFQAHKIWRVCATTSENTDRSQRRIQHANPARLEQISMVKNYVAWRSSSKTDQDESSRVRSSQSLGNKTGGRMERKRIFRKMHLAAREVQCIWHVLPSASTIQIQEHIQNYLNGQNPEYLDERIILHVNVQRHWMEKERQHRKVFA